MLFFQLHPFYILKLRDYAKRQNCKKKKRKKGAYYKNKIM